MSTDKYILDEFGCPVPCEGLRTWGRWLQDSPDRVVKQEEIDGMKISTVFLGLDHNFDGGAPILWETMVFGGPLDEEQDRCGGTRQDALEMHERMKARVTALEKGGK